MTQKLAIIDMIKKLKCNRMIHLEFQKEWVTSPINITFDSLTKMLSQKYISSQYADGIKEKSALWGLVLV